MIAIRCAAVAGAATAYEGGINTRPPFERGPFSGDERMAEAWRTAAAAGENVWAPERGPFTKESEVIKDGVFWFERAAKESDEMTIALTTRLRAEVSNWNNTYIGETLSEAADRIVALTAERDATLAEVERLKATVRQNRTAFGEWQESVCSDSGGAAEVDRLPSDKATTDYYMQFARAEVERLLTDKAGLQDERDHLGAEVERLTVALGKAERMRDAVQSDWERTYNRDQAAIKDLRRQARKWRRRAVDAEAEINGPNALGWVGDRYHKAALVAVRDEALEESLEEMSHYSTLWEAMEAVTALKHPRSGSERAAEADTPPSPVGGAEPEKAACEHSWLCHDGKTWVCDWCGIRLTACARCGVPFDVGDDVWYGDTIVHANCPEPPKPLAPDQHPQWPACEVCGEPCLPEYIPPGQRIPKASEHYPFRNVHSACGPYDRTGPNMAVHRSCRIRRINEKLAPEDEAAHRPVDGIAGREY